ncbi:MAG: HAD family hydrolase, partial [Ruminococcus sp.]|nr:HAD family hydrolase [Ruminococcus sp.]
DQYIQLYVKEIAKLFYEHGFDGKAVAKATMQASYAMAKNDGKVTNSVAFEETFKALMGENAQKAIEIFPSVYADRYNSIKKATSGNPYSKEIVSLMREKADFIVVATQPMFPLEAVRKRLSWIGISDSAFDHVTVYDNSSYCKPNIGYYQEIMRKFSATPKDTLMIGNDVNEDILPCQKLGVDTFLLTDGLINVRNHDITDMRKGNYLDLIDYLKTL